MATKRGNPRQRMRFGVIGCGAIGQEHLRNLRLLATTCKTCDVSITAVCDTSPKMLENAKPYVPSGATAYASYEDLILDPNVDAIIIATPNFHHIEVLRFVLGKEGRERRGKDGKKLLHVLCEKPMCTKVEDCLEVERMLKTYEGMFWVGMEYRYIPSVGRLIDEVDKGTVGKPLMCSIREHRFPFLRKVDDWNRFSKNTGGTLVEKCCHFFDLTARILRPAKPVRVFASGNQAVNHLEEKLESGKGKPNIIDNAFALVEWDTGARSCLDLCMFAEASENQEEISVVGAKGKVEALAPAHGVVVEEHKDAKAVPNVRIGTRRPWVERSDPPPPPPPLQRLCVHAPLEVQKAGYHCGATYFELQAFCEAVVRGDAPTVSARDGTIAVAIGAAAHRSIELKRAVMLKELLDLE